MLKKRPHRKQAINPPPATRSPLSEDEMSAFREDLRQTDQEVQQYFRLYYILGVAATAAWLVSPDTSPFAVAVLQNGGYNVYALLIVAFVNVVSTNYLLYKGLEIHELAQFITTAGRRDNGYASWERWRRSEISTTRHARSLYHLFLIAVPFLVSGGLLYITWQVLSTPVSTLAAAVTPAPSEAQLQQVTGVFASARIAYALVVAAHFSPLVLVYFSLVRVPAGWRRLRMADDSTNKQ
jgi:hypothetical protein